MEAREIQKLLERQQSGDLSPQETLHLEQALAEWEASLNRGDLKTVHQQLKTYRRSRPPETVFKQYQQDLQSTFAPPGRRESPWSRLVDIWNFLKAPRSPWIRVAEALTLLVLGAFFGKMLFYPNAGLPGVAPEPQIALPPMFLYGVSEEERLQMERFFVESEMLLLQIDNCRVEEGIEIAEWEFTREVGRGLLRQLFVMQETAIQQNQLEAIRFLSRIEILLYEIANADREDFQESLPFLKQMIRETNLLREAGKLQEMYEAPSPRVTTT